MTKWKWNRARRHHIPWQDWLRFAVCVTAIVVIAGLGLIRDMRAIRSGERVCIPMTGLHVLCSDGVE